MLENSCLAVNRYEWTSVFHYVLMLYVSYLNAQVDGYEVLWFEIYRMCYFIPPMINLAYVSGFPDFFFDQWERTWECLKITVFWNAAPCNFQHAARLYIPEDSLFILFASDLVWEYLITSLLYLRYWLQFCNYAALSSHYQSQLTLLLQMSETFSIINFIFALIKVSSNSRWHYFEIYLVNNSITVKLAPLRLSCSVLKQ